MLCEYTLVTLTVAFNMTHWHCMPSIPRMFDLLSLRGGLGWVDFPLLNAPFCVALRMRY